MFKYMFIYFSINLVLQGTFWPFQAQLLSLLGKHFLVQTKDHTSGPGSYATLIPALFSGLPPVWPISWPFLACICSIPRRLSRTSSSGTWLSRTSSRRLSRRLSRRTWLSRRLLIVGDCTALTLLILLKRLCKTYVMCIYDFMYKIRYLYLVVQIICVIEKSTFIIMSVYIYIYTNT